MKSSSAFILASMASSRLARVALKNRQSLLDHTNGVDDFLRASAFSGGSSWFFGIAWIERWARFRLAGIENPPVPVVKAGDWKGSGDRRTEGKPRPCANQTEGEKN